jgi:hypothetical protein
MKQVTSRPVYTRVRTNTDHTFDDGLTVYNSLAEGYA